MKDNRCQMKLVSVTKNGMKWHEVAWKHTHACRIWHISVCRNAHFCICMWPFLCAKAATAFSTS